LIFAAVHHRPPKAWDVGTMVPGLQICN
jgi:hypothetical protein